MCRLLSSATAETANDDSISNLLRVRAKRIPWIYDMPTHRDYGTISEGIR